MFSSKAQDTQSIYQKNAMQVFFSSPFHFTTEIIFEETTSFFIFILSRKQTVVLYDSNSFLLLLLYKLD